MKNRRINYSLEEWELIFYKFRVIEKLSIGVSYKALAVDLKENGYLCTGEAVRKAVAMIETHTYKEIAAITGISKSTLIRYMKNNRN
ncbi:hypothetical protein [uncultured Clostridium sp.]|uniref:hypothetical protein n=1 Tax=uncultured Clostridium sp. TaxID=59620 RepID=UPI0025F109EB|nr:hypothetical protein [uncultured Clostridium sp.]